MTSLAASDLLPAAVESIYKIIIMIIINDLFFFLGKSYARFIGSGRVVVKEKFGCAVAVVSVGKHVRDCCNFSNWCTALTMFILRIFDSLSFELH